MSNYYEAYTKRMNEALVNMVVTDAEGRKLPSEEGFNRWCEITKGVKAGNHTMFIVGNGASATMSSHMSADASKNGGFRSMAFNDQALLTAVSNDIAYEDSFAFPLKRFADTGDVLVTISSSGNSPNIVKCISAAQELGLCVVTLSGMKEDNRSRQIGDLNFFINDMSYGIVECAHQVLLHTWLDKYMEENL